MKRLLCLSELLCVSRPLGVSVFFLFFFCERSFCNPPTASQSKSKQTRTRAPSPALLSHRPFARHAHVIHLHFALSDTTLLFLFAIPPPPPILSATAACNWAMIFLQASNKRWLTTSIRAEKKKKKMPCWANQFVVICHFQGNDGSEMYNEHLQRTSLKRN